MENNDLSKQNGHDGKAINNNGIAGVVYILTIIGAAIYYIQQATTFWGGLLGFLKALVWPVFMIYKALEMLKM